MQAIMQLRMDGIKAELYPDNAKIAKQFQHADKRLIPYVVLLGANEIESNCYLLKDLASGEQRSLSLVDLVTFLK